MNAGTATPVSQAGATTANNHLQLVQAALQATNAAAALGLMAPGGAGNPQQPQVSQAAGRTPQGTSPPGSATPSVAAAANPTQAVYSTLQQTQQQQVSIIHVEQ